MAPPSAVYSWDVTDADEQLLNRFYRTLFSLKSGPLKTVREFRVPNCHKEVRSAITSGLIDETDEGYMLTSRGAEALETELKLMRTTSGGGFRGTT